MIHPLSLVREPSRRRSAVAAAVLVTAAAVLLGGCGSGGGGGQHRPSASAAAPSTSGAAGAGPTGSAGSGPSKAAGSAADAPKVPDAQLTPPGGGTFTKKEKKYLSGRVPKGDDPVAVLEGGQEVCERLTRTSAIDPNASASAIVTGDISTSGATAAVRALCPDQEYVLAAAARGFADGSFTVAARPVAGKSVAPGRYHAPNPSPGCTWRVAGAGGKTLASGKAGAAAKATLTVPSGARTVTSSGCYAWLPPIAAPPKKSAGSTPTP
ncbi:hypothetical protein SAMN05216223_101348 [Actinacidiphila yanglinensis]|uniref:DUF732 domain-containing protein n=1 Tax=Actinacidiphila yanglinensis TaxID=310779 RepID=A0A1H5T2R0_9ACTN|nr:hypothetical protein [Actinacidiphila yanglinensis]SEF56448.1 hypothetical protein SAMN05216223_101348 [Actinacidiphila yanglinensis]